MILEESLVGSPLVQIVWQRLQAAVVVVVVLIIVVVVVVVVIVVV